MKKIAKFIGCRVEKGDGVEQLILKMVIHEWGSAYSDQLALDCLRARVMIDDEAFQIWLDAGEALEVLGASDQKAVKEAQARLGSDAPTVKKKIRELAKKVR